MADNREIVGWFYKNGRRIPVRKKSGSDKAEIKDDRHPVVAEWQRTGPDTKVRYYYGKNKEGKTQGYKDIEDTLGRRTIEISDNEVEWGNGRRSTAASDKPKKGKKKNGR